MVMGRAKTFLITEICSAQAPDHFVPLVSFWFGTDEQRTEWTTGRTDGQRTDDNGTDDGTRDGRTDEDDGEDGAEMK